jgi:predicted CoA-binding protein
MEKTASDSQIVIVGMTDKVDRYAYMAYEKLMDHGFHNIVGVTPKEISFEDIKKVPNLAGVQGPVHTITLYIGSKKVNDVAEQIIELKPKRIIFNPGTESKKLIRMAEQKGIEAVVGCTLVMLASDQF